MFYTAEFPFDDVLRNLIASIDDQKYTRDKCDTVVMDKDGNTCITHEVPGVKRDDINVTIDQNARRLAIEYTNRLGLKRTYQYDISGLNNVAEKDVDATLVDGLLTVTVRPSVKSQAIKIPIK